MQAPAGVASATRLRLLLLMKGGEEETTATAAALLGWPPRSCERGEGVA